MEIKKKLTFLKKPWVLALAVLILAGGGFWIYKAKSSSETQTYKTAQVTKGTLTVSVTGTGNVIVDNSAVINPSISGEVYDLSVKVGDKVEEGQTLFKIKNDDLDVSVSKAYVTYLQAKQNIESTKSQLLEAQNTKATIDNDSKSTDAQKEAASQKVTAAEIAITAAEANSSSAYSQYTQAQKTAAQRTVKATISGTIITLNITNGDQLGSSGSGSSQSSSSSSSSGSSTSASSSSAPIVIDDLGSLKASVSINEVDATSVKKDQKVSMTFDAIDGLTSTGKIEQISTVGTNSSGVVTYPATISFDSIDGRIKPQMSMTATITTDVKQDVLMVSNSAVKTNSSDSSRYVLKMVDGSPVNTTVEVGSSNDSDTEIKSGLSEGDTVVTRTVTATSSATATSSKSNQGMNGGMMMQGMGGGPGN